jgi:hypothetical protein
MAKQRPAQTQFQECAAVGETELAKYSRLSYSAYPEKGILYEMAYIFVIHYLVCGEIEGIRHTFLKEHRA